MNNLLEVNNLSKKYEKFELKDVSFKVSPGTIMGFIGRNGAGKTTTLKSIMNLIHFDKGEVIAFDKNMKEFELENKQKIGFSLSEINYYPNKTINQLVNVTKRFYKDFDMDKFNKLCEMFSLDKTKKIEALSSGMKVKYSVAIALSHNASLLILDEPTSGLDPISRDEVIDLFHSIVKDGKKSILFSTHITSDLDKCATDITYISEGKIEYTGSKKEFIDLYLFVTGNLSFLSQKQKEKFISFKEIENKFEGLIFKKDEKLFDLHVDKKEPDLEQIMVFLERRKRDETFAL